MTDNWTLAGQQIASAIETFKEFPNTPSQKKTDAHQKDISLPAGTDTPGKFIENILAPNKGLMIAGIRTQSAGFPLIFNNTGSLKDAWADTIYLDVDKKDFDKLSKLSAPELQARLDSRTKETIKAESEQVAKRYKTESAHDHNGEMLKLFIAAKTNNIELVHLDKAEDPKKNAEMITAHQKQKPEDSRYLVLADITDLASLQHAKSLAKELEIPTAAFDKSVHESIFKVRKTGSKKDFDFYLPGNDCYPKIKELLVAADMEDMSKTRSAPQSWVYALASKDRNNVFENTLHYACQPANHAEEKQPAPSLPKTLVNQPSLDK